MTTPETPASVDGGPDHEDTCPWCGTGIEYHSNCDGPRENWPTYREERVWLTCPNEECPVQPSTLACKTMEEADAAWNRRPSTRDAALREEGRVQERARLEDLAKRLDACASRDHGYADGFNGEGLAFYRSNARELEAIASAIRRAHAPDASQGSAPVARDVKPENVSHAARLADELRKVHPGHGFLYPGECAPCDALHDYDSGAPPAAPQGSPLPGQAWEPDYGDVNAVATIATTDDRLWRLSASHARVLGFNQADDSAARALFYLFAWRKRRPDALAATARNPPEGGALEGERTWQQERADVVAWLRTEWGTWHRLVLATKDGRNRDRQTAVLRCNVLRGAWEEIEGGRHLQPPAPAIPQSGDEKEGT